MKTLIFCCIATLLYASAVFGQCEAPIIENWQYVGEPIENQIIDQTFSIDFTAPSGSAGYGIAINSTYALDTMFLPEEEIAFILQDAGSVSEGLNSLEITIPAGEISQLGSGGAYHYFTASLWLYCASGDSSQVADFYLSAHSLLNEPAFSCGDKLITPLKYIEDADDSDTAITEYEIIIDTDTGQELVENLSVFLDIGHTCTVDLSIYLESPQGTVVRLLDFMSTGIWFQEGLSVVFNDDAPAIIDTDETYAGARGFYSSYELLSAFDGEPMDGTWKLTIQDILGEDDGMLAGVCLLFDELPCATSITGTAYYDLNENAAFDAGDVPFSWPNVGSGIDGQNVWGGESGNYFICSATGEGYISLLNTPDYYTVDSINLEGQEGSLLENSNFPLVGIPGYNDLVLDIYSNLPDVPGAQTIYYINYNNVGTECIEGVELIVSFPESMEIVSSSNPELQIDGGTISQTIDELCPQSGVTFMVTIETGVEVEMGTVLNITGAISPLENDETPWDNELTYESEVVASYDPNDKTVSEGVIYPSFMENDQSLKYTIRFQNDGTYFAQNVEIVDEISPALDLSTLEILAHTDPMQVSVEGNVLKFTFNDIWLPWSDVGLEESQGFVRFQIEPIDDYDGPELIANSAEIYFDFNEPIITNTALTSFQSDVGINEHQLLKARIYPNPFNDDLTIEWDAGVDVESILLFDVSGRVVRNIPINKHNQIQLNLAALGRGIYTMVFESDQHLAPQRIVKY